MPFRHDARILRRLQYFEATARLGSIKRAAEELSVSPSAVSHQLSDLKKTFGEDLFSTTSNGVELTAAGQQLSQRISTAFRILDSSVSDLVGGSKQVVRIAACSSFGPYWLTPRIGDFRRAYSGIELELRLYGEDPELTQATADCIITAHEVKPGFIAIDLFEERAFAVAAPDVAEAGRLSQLALITTDIDEYSLGADWRAFAEISNGLWSLPPAAGWLRCSHYILALEMAKAGLGIALIPDFVAEPAIADGQLTRVGRASFSNDNRMYRACFKEAHRSDPDIQAVVGWLRRAARNR